MNLTANKKRLVLNSYGVLPIIDEYANISYDTEAELPSK